MQFSAECIFLALPFESHFQITCQKNYILRKADFWGWNSIRSVQWISWSS